MKLLGEGLSIIAWIRWDEAWDKQGLGRLWPSEKYDEVLEEDIKRNGWRFSGETHQHFEGGRCPLYSDGTSGAYSMRAWGDIMAKAIDGPDGYYGDYAWNCDDEKIPPLVIDLQQLARTLPEKPADVAPGGHNVNPDIPE